VKSDLQPVFDWLSGAFSDLCSRYTEEELRLMIGFARDFQLLLEQAIDNLQKQHRHD
jgi:hypothetical protein